jgi:hypothetical protein
MMLQRPFYNAAEAADYFASGKIFEDLACNSAISGGYVGHVTFR